MSDKTRYPGCATGRLLSAPLSRPGEACKMSYHRSQYFSTMTQRRKCVFRCIRIRVSLDTSKDGLGAVILQKKDAKWMPVAYASWSLTPAKRNYAQIEKELLGVVFACERFYCYVYGRKFVAETDHKPLISISQKPLSAASPRLQQLLLRLQKFDLELVYAQGKNNW